MRGATAVRGLVLAAALLLPGSTAGAVPPAPAVVLFGDSLTVQAAPDLPGGWHVHAYGGTAPCDWQARFRDLVRADRATVVVFAFVGNDSTPCMRGTVSAQDAAARYRRALADMGGYAVRLRLQVRFVWPPPTAYLHSPAFAFAGAPEIGQAECALASTARRWARCDTAARDRLSIAGLYSQWIGGVRLRADDGIHLAPAGIRVYADALRQAAR